MAKNNVMGIFCNAGRAGVRRMELGPKARPVPARYTAQRPVWSIVLVLIGVSHALAQTPPRGVPVAGTVLDPSGAGAAGATVTLKRGPDTVLSSTQADDVGRFRF